jgi:gluconolactonase
MSFNVEHLIMKKLSIFLLFVALASGSAGAQKQTASPAGSSVQKLDPAMDAIVSPNAKLEILKGDFFGNAEGPVWVKEGQSGYLLFSDISANDIYKWTADGKMSVFLQRTGFNSMDTGPLQTAGYVGSYNGRFYPTSFGSNGTALDPQGRIVWTAQGDRAIVRLEKDGKTRTILADKYQGKRLNRPNDLVVKSDGWVYFTDPHSNNPGAGNEWPSSVYRIKEPGQPQLLVNDVQPNGIAFSADEKYLYVAGGKIWRYDVNADGTLANVKELNPVGCDGIKLDLKGNIYCATGQDKGVRVLSSEGKHLGTILTPQDGVGPTNLAFGDPDGKTLYITIKRSLARIRLNIAGLRPSS